MLQMLQMLQIYKYTTPQSKMLSVQHNNCERTAAVRAEVNDNSGHISGGGQFHLPPVVGGSPRVRAVWGFTVIGIRLSVTGPECCTHHKC